MKVLSTSYCCNLIFRFLIDYNRWISCLRKKNLFHSVVLIKLDGKTRSCVLGSEDIHLKTNFAYQVFFFICFCYARKLNGLSVSFNFMKREKLHLTWTRPCPTKDDWNSLCSLVSNVFAGAFSSSCRDEDKSQDFRIKTWRRCKRIPGNEKLLIHQVHDGVFNPSVLRARMNIK